MRFRLKSKTVKYGCASGGMRMDHKTLSAFSLMSTSDQIHYDRYPYIAGNILCAVLPEQAAVWNLGDAGIVTAQIANIQKAWVAYPSKTDAEVFWNEQELNVKFPRSGMAAFLEINML